MKWIASLAAIAWTTFLTGTPLHPEAAIYQVSTRSALEAGVLDATYSYKDIMQKGSLGLGLVGKMNGEVIAVDGHYFHIETSGKAVPLDPDETCPYARVVPFNPAHHFMLSKEKGIKVVTRRILQQLSNPNTLYAIKIQGVFPRVKMRVFREGTPPHTSLEDARAEQNEFTLYDVKGTVVGFYTPEFLTPSLGNEFTFAFLSSDHKTGGRVLDMSLETVNVLLQPIHRTEIIFPTHLTYQHANIKMK